MQKNNKMISRFLALAVVVFILAPLSGWTSEPAQRLLNELTQPGLAPAAVDSGLPEQLPVLEEVSVDQQQDEQAEFFTLEELNRSRVEDDLRELAEAEIPASDIPLALNSKVEFFLYFFQTRGKMTFSRWLSRSSRYLPMMKEIMRREQLPEDLVYVAMIESGFHMHARSFANAVGPWQFISDTGRRYALRIDQWIDERKDPVKSTLAAAMYLKELYKMFNGDWYLAAAGYNAGENKIFRAISRYNTNDFWEISQGSYLARETKEYVPKLLAAAIIAKDPARYGFSDIAYLPPIEYDSVIIPSRTDLELVARLANTSYESIRDLNPELKHWCTPPNYPDYELKIPKGTKASFEAAYSTIPDEQRFTEKTLYARYLVRKKDTLRSVARKFRSTPAILAEINGLSTKAKIGGMTLLVPARQTVDFVKEGRSVGGKGAKGAKFTYYTVQKGDTLDAIAHRFKITSRVLASWNNLKGKLVLKPGRRLIVARLVNKNGKMVPVQVNG